MTPSASAVTNSIEAKSVLVSITLGHRFSRASESLHGCATLLVYVPEGQYCPSEPSLNSKPWSLELTR